MAARYKPRPIPRSLLSQLYRITRTLPQQIKSQNHCPHHHYQSIHCFENHLLSLLNHNARYYAVVYRHQELNELISLLRKHSLCAICRNTILSNTPFQDLFLGKELISCANESRGHLYLFLYCRFFDHPRFPKIMMQICSKSMHHFQSLCIVFEWLLNITLRGTGDHLIGHKFVAMVFARFIFLTMRYWKRRHYRFWKTYHSDTIRNWLRKLAEPSTYREVELGLTNVSTRPDGTVSTLSGSEQMHNTMCCVDQLVQYILLASQSWNLTISIFKQVLTVKQIHSFFTTKTRQAVQCSLESCRKLEYGNEKRFKLCGGCKMTYYCSRSCQKRAWSNHKEKCSKLSRLYRL